MLKTKILLLLIVLTSLSTFSQKKWDLEQCVNYALKNNITVKQNKLNVQLAEKDIEIAKGNFLPSLSGSTSPGLNFGSSIGQNGSRISTDNFRSGFSLNSNTTLYNGNRNKNTLKQSKLSVEGSKIDLAQVEDNISLQIVNTYLNVLFAKENLAVAKMQAEVSKKQVERAKIQYNAGTIPKGGLLNAESTSSNDLQKIVTQENALNLALLQLTQLLQIPSEGFDVKAMDVSDPSVELLYSNSNTIYQKALDIRPEIKRADLNVENANLNIELSKGAYYPTLSFSAGAGSSYQYIFNKSLINDPYFTQLNNNLGYNLGLSLNVPIFNRFQTKNNVAKSKINKEISEFRLENTKLQLQQTIEQAFLDVKSAAKTYEAAQVSLTAQKEAFKNAQASYDYGSMTQFDFDQVRNRLANAKSEMIRAKYDYIFKTKVLKFYSGESIF
ncbi:TolC family protein [Tenacibaculum sp. UWU-22]|uniref:TolC family protein n=1 Tax=Tenacibaculum sp. UWU-22 TaxID=3234187 RepID=UPI0034DAF278